MCPFGLPNIKLAQASMTVLRHICSVEDANFPSIFALEPSPCFRGSPVDERSRTVRRGKQTMQNPLSAFGDVRALHILGAGQNRGNDCMMFVARLRISRKLPQKNGCKCARAGGYDEMKLIGLKKVRHTRIHRTP